MNLYIGKPYSFRKFNCWDYVAKVRADNNIKTKLFQPVNMENAFDTITAEMQKLGHGLTKVTTPRDFDIVITKKDTSKRPIYHCGLFYGGGVAHCSVQEKQVVYSSLSEFKANANGVTFWR